MLIQPTEEKEFYTEERCFILELLNNPEITNDVSIARAKVKPGITTALHTLKGIEIYYILEGKGEVEINGKVDPIKPGELCYIKPGFTQRITNTGKNDLIFLCVCTPKFTNSSYKSLE